MFASDPKIEATQLAVLASSVRMYALQGIATAVLGVLASLGCLAFLVHETLLLHRPPMGLMSLAALGIVVGGGVLAARTLQPATFAMLGEPTASEIYRTLQAGGDQVVELGAVVGRRHVVRLRLRDGRAFELPVSPAEVRPLLEFLQMRFPRATPYR
jgi:hypothetical protein